MKMAEVQTVAVLWLLLVAQTGQVCSDTRFLERSEGDSVVLLCEMGPKSPPPLAVYLNRSWLRPGKVLFKLEGNDFHVENDGDKNRTGVSGEPSSHRVEVTISDLRASDTDRYHCEFVMDNPSSEDIRLPGQTDFFLLVTADAAESEGSVKTCAGGSVVIPCLPPSEEGLAVEGVSLKRQRGRGPVEELYHSKRPPSSTSHFPEEKVHLTSAPGPTGITYNLTLRPLQPDDSGTYSCQLLLRGRPDGTGLGRRVVFVSVQGGQCGCSGYSSLLYALSSAVAILVLILFGVFVVMYKGKPRRNVKSHPQAPIYEEMTGVKGNSRKRPEETGSEYRNCSPKKSCLENHYESPTGSLYPRRGSQE